MAQVIRRFLTLAQEAASRDDLILALLVVATSHYGLSFNRACFFALDRGQGLLKGDVGLGPATLEEAQALWSHLSRVRLDLPTIFRRVREQFPRHDRLFNEQIRGLSFSLEESSNPLVVAMNRREAFCVGRSPGCLFQWRALGLHRIFSQTGFVVAPVACGDHPMGVVVADNAITGAAIERSQADALSLLSDVAAAQIESLLQREALERRLERLEDERARVAASQELVIESERRHAMGQLAEQLSHHLRNPLSILGGVAKRLGSRQRLDGVRQYIEVIIEQTQKMEESLNSLFSFSEPLDLHLAEGRLSEVVQRAAVALEPLMRPRGVSWHLCLRSAERPIFLDSQRMEGAFIHIIRNSIEAMPDGGLILITQEEGDQEVVVQVADTGAGMMSGLVGRAVEPFFSLKNRGLGLGLSIARQVVEAHGGGLAVRPNRLGGVTVEVALPAKGQGG